MRWTLTQKVSLAAGLCLVLFIGMGVRAMIGMRASDIASRHLAQHTLTLIEQRGRFSLHVMRVLAETEAYGRAKLPRDRDEAVEMLELATADVATLRDLYTTEEHTASALHAEHLRIQERREDVLTQARQATAAAFQAVTSNDAARIGDAFATIEAVEDQLEQLQVDEQAVMVRDVTSSTAALEQQNQFGLIFVPVSWSLVIGLMLGALLALRRVIVRPITAVAVAARAIARGDLRQTLAVTSTDELGDVQRAFNQMARSLERQSEALTRERDELRAQIEERKQAEAALRNSEAKYRAVVQNIQEIVYIVDTEQDLLRGTPVLVSEQIENATGYPPEAFIHNRELWLQLLHPDDIPLVQQSDAELKATKKPLTRTYRLRHRYTDDYHWLEDRVVPQLDAAGRIVQLYGLARDVTERRRTEEALQQSEARLAEAQRMAHLGNWSWDARTGEVFWSDETYRIFGYEPRSVVPTPEHILSAVHPDDRAFLMPPTIPDAPRDGPHEADLRLLLPDGTERVVHQQVQLHVAPDGTLLKMSGTVQDITERKRLEQQMAHQAFHDALTGLPNRTLVLDRLTYAVARNHRTDRSIAVLFLDLDGFKVVNDGMGHTVGDQLLVAVARRLAGCLRPGDTIARWGGDEFTVLLDDVTDPGQAQHIADRILEALVPAFVLDARTIVTTPSIGIAVSTGAKVHPDDLLRAADLAMYHAKARGKAQYQVFDASMRVDLMERLELEAGLRHALERGELEVYYQPKVALKSGEVTGFEALVRWNHPAHGMVSPAQFILLAEETGLILPIGQWVLEQACHQAKRWHAEAPPHPPLSVHVNLSARQFQNPDLVAEVAQVLRATGMTPQALILEITETVVMDDGASSSATLRELKALGVQLAIDDFGTGYSSLSYLRRFPVDVLKIDKAFVDGLGHDSEATAIVQAVITLAHTLGMSVVAEGIETAVQVAHLNALGCDAGQGYYFAKPLPSPAAGRLLSEVKNPAGYSIP